MTTPDKRNGVAKGAFTVPDDIDTDNATIVNESQKKQKLADYRQWLVASEQKSQEDFDKTILSLSGGALGISFVFLKDIIGISSVEHPMLLFAAWLAWGVSSTSVLISYYLSHLALRCAIKQVDNGTIHNQVPGGLFSKAISIFNGLGGLSFIVGVCCVTVFAGFNLYSQGEINGREATKPTPTTSSTASIPTPSDKR